MLRTLEPMLYAEKLSLPPLQIVTDKGHCYVFEHNLAVEVYVQ